MIASEICRSYHSARHKAQQIQILAELNDTDSLEIIKALVRGGERLPDSTVNKLFKRLDKLEIEIREREREYKAIAAALKGAGAYKAGDRGGISADYATFIYDAVLK